MGYNHDRYPDMSFNYDRVSGMDIINRRDLNMGFYRDRYPDMGFNYDRVSGMNIINRRDIE